VKRSLALALLLFAADASASDPVNTAGKLDCTTGICTPHLVQQTVPFDSTAFTWTSLTQQFNNASAGENVATYSQMWKQASGTSWAFVAENRCINKRGGCHGAEIDLVVDGPLQDGDWRLGQSIVIWRMPNSAPGAPTANYGLLIAPQWDQRENIRVDVGVGIQTRCNVACLQIRSGESIALDDAGQITIRYNPVSGAIEFRNGARVVSTIATQ
jgi:hypothetical protein